MALTQSLASTVSKMMSCAHLVAGGEADEFADRRLIGRLGEMHRDVPASVRPLERGDRGLALEKALGQEIDDALGGRLAADGKGGAVGGG